MPFKKGDPNINRKGRPKKEFALSNELEKFMSKTIEVSEKGQVKRRNVMKVFIERVVKQALAGDTTCMKYVWDRLEGTPTIKTSVEMLNINVEDIKNMDKHEREELRSIIEQLISGKSNKAVS